nr:hypothetical protein [Tanacetum cinerariifolium]
MDAIQELASPEANDFCWLVQKQTALGKDTSNPLIVDSLLKTIWFSIHHHRTIEVLAIPGQTATGVNTPRSDEDRLKLIELMVFLLQKDVYGEIGITAARLSSYCCQANVSAVCTAMASAVICLSKGQRFNFSKYIFDSIVRNVDSSSKFYMVGKGFSGVETPLYESMIADRQPADEELGAEQVQVNAAVVAAVVEDVVEDVAEDVAHVDTPSPPPHGIPSPLQKPFSPHQQPHVTPPAPTQGEAFPATFQQVLDTCFALLCHVKHLEHDNVAQRLEIVNLKARVKKLEKTDKIKSSKLRRLRKVGASRQVESSDDMEDVFNQGRMINEDERIELVKDVEIDESEGRQADKQAEIYNIDLDHSLKVLSMQEDDSEVQEVVEVMTTAKLITEVVTAIASQVSAASTTILADSATIPAANPTISAAAPTVVATYTRKRKGVIIRDPEEELYLKTSETPAETLKVKDKGKGIMIEASKPMKKKDQIEMDAEYARKEEIEAEDQEIIKSINETPAQKAAKRRKLSEEAQKAKDLRKRLEIMFEEPDKQDAIWRNQKSVHGLALVKRWKLLASCDVHVITLLTVQLFLLVERRYSLSRFTLEQLVNVVGLQVKEESGMSLELLSKSKDCKSNIDVARLKLKLFKNIVAAEDITK